ncbi:flagellar biosynthesis anti-sigma factor FlgM [Tepidiforma sp.]|uniref:flagellar biosynthesis anti-sigma factor FlgM n=1 Tax=Tepidiforma sp. TaxID=2682230 RepID=UPI002ADD79F4|nr:flagellar biosynthesis anti-sigma factor FlgM [Tepidiforma sp.]
MTEPPKTAPTVVPFDDRTRRVLELRELIRRGAYQPDPQAVARALLEHWRDTRDIDSATPTSQEFEPSRFVVATEPAPTPLAKCAS